MVSSMEKGVCLWYTIVRTEEMQGNAKRNGEIRKMMHAGHRTKQAGHYEMDTCSGPILGKMLLFALPLMASSILQLLFNAADVIVVGKFAGDNSLAAVGSNSSLINLLTNLFLGLSVGVNVLVSRYYGARDTKNVSDTVHTAVAISLLSGVWLAIFGFFGSGSKYWPLHICRKRDVKSGRTASSPFTSIDAIFGTIVPSSPGK